jgi:hypothetical protein
MDTDRVLALLEEMREAVIWHDMDGSAPPGRHPLGPELSLDDLCETLRADVAELRELAAGAPWLARLDTLTRELSEVDDDLRARHGFTPAERDRVPALERELVSAVVAAGRLVRAATTDR